MSSPAGFSLIETLVALLIFSLVAAGLATRWVAGDRHTSAAWRRVSWPWRRPSARARGPTEGATAEGSPADRARGGGDYPDLARVRVTVGWTDREPRELALVTLMSMARSNE
jgi:prepilin-type N-terminal cleavage/methylation domain-containing protein